MEFQATIKRIDTTKQYGQDGAPIQRVRITLETTLPTGALETLQAYLAMDAVTVTLR